MVQSGTTFPYTSLGLYMCKGVISQYSDYAVSWIVKV